LENSTIQVCQTSQYIAGKGIITKSPKNETSVRSVSVPGSVITLLKQYKVEQNKDRLRIGDKWQETDRLFTTWDGRPMHPTTVSSWYPEFLRKHNLPKIRFHDLRHTAATLLITQNVHMKTISSRLGHSNIQTTMDIYGHALKSADQSAAEKLDFLFKSETKRQGTNF
jgi:integrase